ncbi:peptide deformylase [Actinomycetaceae bacterium MB13-C1-2]|nr:peptide deformylase [Actinomycetaceae bacterium MB13-C1-2]
MTILPIRIYGDPVLHNPVEPVGEISEEIRTLVGDMYQTMDAAPGVGLAGPQVGVGKALFTYSWTDEDGNEHRGVAIDPVLWIEPTVPDSLLPAEEDEEEGCLSVPGERFALRRSERVLLVARDINGEVFEIEAEGWLARIFQHEYDHLGGVIYVDRLDAKQHKQAFKTMKKRGWNTPDQSWLPGRDNLED